MGALFPHLRGCGRSPFPASGGASAPMWSGSAASWARTPAARGTSSPSPAARPPRCRSH